MPKHDQVEKIGNAASRKDAGPISPIAEIIEEARNGRMFILVDDEDRENEGDLVIPAQMATPDAVNFMAKHGRGLICLALCSERIGQLQLPAMSANNGTEFETAFTISIEAKEGVTTGISASDRALTISTAIDSSKGANDIVSPGHVFPLAARDGGVLVRAGHTEASVDISRLAGLNASGVICEIMNDDGTMSRMEQLVPFAERHGLKIGTIRDLIAYRRIHDHNVERVAEIEFESGFGGTWKAITFRNKFVDAEMVALIKGHIDPDRPTLVRMHQLSLFSDTLAEPGPRSGWLSRAMETIAAAGSGVVVLINRPIPDRYSRQMRLRRQRDPSRKDVDQLRDYGIGAQILADLGVHSMILLSNSDQALVAVEGYGLSILERREF